MTTVSKVLVAAAITLGAGVALASNDNCRYEGTSYSHGSTVCQSGTQFRCDDGDWKSLSVACPAKDAKSCEFDGTSYSAGSASCQSGTQYRCEAGTWRSLGAACAPGELAVPRVAPPAGRTCMLDGSTVSSKSTVCKSGVMFMCDDGDWRNLGTPCQ